MKTSLPVLAAAAWILVSCSSPKTTTTTTTTTTSENAAKDQIEYYETEFEVRQTDHLAQLTGDWSVHSMQRQSMMPLEKLNDISIRLHTDKTFEAGLSCGQVSGTYTLKGTSIKFATEGSPACSNDEQMVELIRLLTQTVSAYSVDNKTLLLRDGSSNVIFRAVKQ